MNFKKLTLLFYLIPHLFFSSACSNGNTTTFVKHTDTLVKPAGKIFADAHYPAVLDGQTRAPRITTKTSYSIEKIGKGLKNPWAIIPLSEHNFLITERGGTMQLYDEAAKLFTKIKGLPAVDFGGQGGLLDVASDPSYSSNHIIYWSFSEKNGKGNLTSVAKGELDIKGGLVKNPRIIFRATPALQSSLHFGSRLLFDSSGYLYVSAGERFIGEGRPQAQQLNSGLGKIFRITKEGKDAPGNPYVNKAGALAEIYSYGHRNPQSLDINPVTGELWEAEFGPFGGDELNIIKAGKNYGWPVITYGLEYSGEKIGEGLQQKAGMEQPVYFWDPVISPSGMIFYTGKAIPEWTNNLFICGLSSMQLVRLVIKNNKVIGEESLLANLKERMRDIAQYNGMLYIVTDAGNLYLVKKK